MGSSAYIAFITGICFTVGALFIVLTRFKYIEKAAPMHDVGKIAIPDAILKKPGKLEQVYHSDLSK